MQSGWSIYEVALASCAIYLAHAFVLAPAAAAAVRRSSATRVGFWAAVSVAVDASRLVFLMLTISACLTWVVIAITGVMGGETVVGVEAAIAHLHGIRSTIMLIESGGSVLLLTLAFSALLFWIVRHHHRRAADVADEIRKAQLEDLLEKFTNGELPDLPPTPEMEKQIQILELLSAQKSEIEARLAQNPNVTESANLNDDLRAIAEHQNKVFRALVFEDLSRRVEIDPRDAIEGDMPRPPRNWRERVGRALISRGLLGRLSWGQRGLLLLNLLLSIPTVLSATQVDIARRLQASEFRLASRAVRWTRDATQRLASAVEVAEAEAQATQQSASQQDDDDSSAQIGHVARTIGQAYERGITDAFARIVRPDPSPPDGPQVLAQRAAMRGQKARRDILAVVASRNPGSGIYVDPDPVPPPPGRVAPNQDPLLPGGSGGSGTPGGSGGLGSPGGSGGSGGFVDDARETAAALARNDGK